ncbi:MAG: type IV toxin-antitoxin system AbiEi family antitoxin [Candidatus Algichlamydia australiensis]|nr:type IV toxin-antitoxin system AbiEi family antitoxin [Chlamydiales bacterium]
MEDPWVIAEQLFSPCFITGLTAAQYWDFTEQIVEVVTVFTEIPIRHRKQEIGKVRFVFKQTSQEKRFGLKKIWRDNIPVYFADPSRTLVDLLADPALGGGIVSVEEILLEYWRSDHLNRDLLLNYVKKYNNKTIFKRLGFLLEKNQFEEENFLKTCRENISKGYSQLDPSIKGSRLSKRWGLWYPEKYNIK